MARLNENQANRVWQKMVEAEIRALYFGDLATQYTTRKQIITGSAFFLSSGAAASVVGKLPSWVPTALALIAAIATAYSMAVGLDKRVGTLTKLHCQWSQLCTEYERLWNHWHDDDAETNLNDLAKRAREASEAAMEMPYDEALVDKWESRVHSRLGHATT